MKPLVGSIKKILVINHGSPNIKEVNLAVISQCIRHGIRPYFDHDLVYYRELDIDGLDKYSYVISGGAGKKKDESGADLRINNNPHVDLEAKALMYCIQHKIPWLGIGHGAQVAAFVSWFKDQDVTSERIEQFDYSKEMKEPRQRPNLRSQIEEERTPFRDFYLTEGAENDPLLKGIVLGDNRQAMVQAEGGLEPLALMDWRGYDMNPNPDLYDILMTDSSKRHDGTPGVQIARLRGENVILSASHIDSVRTGEGITTNGQHIIYNFLLGLEN